MKQYKLYVFDFDGTLADTSGTIISTYHKTLDLMGIPQIPDDDIRHVIGLPLDQCFEICVEPSRIDEATSTYRMIFNEIAPKTTKPFDGVLETLRELSGRGCTLATATSRRHDSLFTLCETTGIGRYITGHRHCTQDVANPKPAPDMVQLSLDETGISPKDTLVIGDTSYDVMMGNNAGCDSCGASWGTHTREMLQSANPTYIIDDIRELI